MNIADEILVFAECNDNESKSSPGSLVARDPFKRTCLLATWGEYVRTMKEDDLEYYAASDAFLP